MKNYVELECLGYVLPQELSVGLILNGLTTISITWGRQLVNYMLCSLIIKKGLPKKAETPQVMMIKGGKIQKSNKKSLKAKAKDDTCHHYKEVGHCKRNCPAYLDELIKKKKQVGIASSSDVFIIELFSFPTKSWVYDTSCDNCHYAPSITRGVVSVHRLVENGFVQCFMDFGFEPPQEEEILIRRSERSRRVPNCLCLNVEAEEHSLGDLNEPTSYKDAMLDSESNKWINAMNAKIQSMIDNMVDPWWVYLKDVIKVGQLWDIKMEGSSANLENTLNTRRKKWRLTGKNMMIIGVYAPQEGKEKQQLFGISFVFEIRELLKSHVPHKDLLSFNFDSGLVEVTYWNVRYLVS
ncbi:retrovirus-related pol polyprotein from transposon TNT 1-94 [Tanacetum coccineum]